MDLTFEQRAYALLQRFYGYHSFRAGQLDIIRAVSTGRDALVLMPTGGGKSICYQLPALMLPGCAVIVTPLIALMHDQVERLVANGVPAAAVNSNNNEDHNREAMEAARQGKIKLLYISPERLIMDMDRWGKNFEISLFAIDEAHCISQWGHDFRPVYTQLSHIKEVYSDKPVIALTATADRLTRDDIAKQLRLDNPLVHVSSFDRPNIRLTVERDPGKNERLQTICALIRRHPNDAGIVYCISRAKAEAMHNELTRRGYRSVCYHAGMPAAQRTASQEAFISGRVNVVCATVAFGMGIDKSNIRWVVHNNIPGNIESYYQELGRSGRDGLPAEAILFYSISDVITRRRFAEETTDEMKHVKLAKLRAMSDYAEATVCRRRMLMSYFGEEMNHDCGNCDVCSNPPTQIDGTVFAQMAISAALRTGEKLTANMLCDVLRGNPRPELVQRGYDKIRTFGVGRDLSRPEWDAYLTQMVLLGILEPAFEDNGYLRVTPLGRRVVQGLETIRFSKYTPTGRGAKKNSKRQAPAITVDPVQQLLEHLKGVRNSVAAAYHVAADIVFGDVTLYEMARVKPTTLMEFSRITGVSEIKAVRFGKEFIAAIRKFEGIRTKEKGTTYVETLLLHNAGYTIKEMARLKGVKEQTIAGHIARHIEDGLITDYQRYITPEQYRAIAEMIGDDENFDYTKIDAIYGPGRYTIYQAIRRKVAGQ